MSDYPADLPLTQAEIAAGLRRLGLTAGSGVMVHSSLKSFGKVADGAQTVIEALMEVITPEGTILMPSFNHGAAFEEGGPGYYHPGETICTNGAIPNTFWRMLGVERSLDPTHAYAAWGRNARRYTRFHHRTLTMGPQSPLGMLQADGGFGLLMGIGYYSNTFHHVVEMSTGAPCLGQRSEAYPVVLPDGRRVNGRTWGWRETACPINDNALYQEKMEARGLHTVETIGASRVTLYRLQDGFEVIAGLLRSGKNGYPPCSRCPIRPRRVPQTVPSDWDSETQALVPESEAWQY
jgi:aminoglycoside 3-N-acetyltransferase